MILSLRLAMHEWIIRKATTGDARQLAALARRIYRQYYLHLWYDSGNWYQQTTYNEEKIKEELADPRNHHFIAARNQEDQAYLKLVRGASLEGFPDRSCMELERIYIDLASSGQGLGRLLVQKAESLAKTWGHNLIFLKAMDTSHGPIAFYQKMGFTNCGILRLPYPLMKEEYRGMVIMKKDL